MAKPWSIETQVIHGDPAHRRPDAPTRAPLVQATSYGFETAEALSDAFAGREPGFIYQRLRNPTNETLEERLALLEGGAGALVTSSGMAAITNAILAICRTGDEVLAGNSLFVTTFLLMNAVLRRFGISVRHVESADTEAWRRAITPRTKMLFAETIGNPKLDVPDIARLAELAHAHQAPLVVDNTLATPWLFRPLDHGADIVVHSTTKFLNGHGTAVGGVVIDSGRFDWPDEKYPDFKLSKERKGPLAFLDKVWREVHINIGTCQAPFHSYLTLIGLDTLAVRMERHVQNALAVAEFLRGHPRVKSVNYPGLPDSPSHATAQAQFGGRGFGALLTFTLEDEAACFAFIRRLRLVYQLANLGDCKSLVIHPWSSQYVNFPEEARRACGITPGLLRLSVGIEHIGDIRSDLDQALKAT